MKHAALLLALLVSACASPGAQVLHSDASPTTDADGTVDLGSPADDGAADAEIPWEELVPTLGDDVRVLDPNPCVSEVWLDSPSGTYGLGLLCHPDELDLRPGVVAVGLAAGGFLLEVEHVERVGYEMFFSGSPVALDRVIAHGGFGVTFDVGEQRSILDFDDIPLHSSQAGAGMVRLSLDAASVDLDQRVKLGGQYDCGDAHPSDEGADCNQLVRSRALLDLRAQGHIGLAVEFDAAASVSGSTELAVQEGSFMTMVGPLPVVILTELRISAVWSASASGQVRATLFDFAVEGNQLLGGRWQRGEGWEMVNERTWEAELIGPRLDTSAGATASIGLKAELRMRPYGVNGPSMFVEPYLAANATMTCTTMDWWTEAGLRLGAALNLQPFASFGINPAWDWSRALELASGSEPLPFPNPDSDCVESGGEPGTGTGGDVSGDGGVGAPAADSCIPVASLWCGGAIGADTATSTYSFQSIDTWPIAVGNYSGPEVAFDWVATHTGTVEVGLLGAQPTVVNHDLFVIEAVDGACGAEQAIAWGPNSLSFDAVAGRTYYIVADGYDGDAGYVAVEMECPDE